MSDTQCRKWQITINNPLLGQNFRTSGDGPNIEWETCSDLLKGVA